MEVDDADLGQRVLGGAQHAFVDPAHAAIVDLFDPRRVDAAVCDEVDQGDACGLAAHRVEAAEQDRFGGVVDEDVDAGDLLEGTDVAALTSDDAALHVVAGQVHCADHRFRGLLGGDPLDGGGDDAPREAIRVALRGGLDVTGERGGGELGLAFRGGDHLVTGVLHGQGGDALQFRGGALLHEADLFALIPQLDALGVEAFGAGDQPLGLSRQPVLAFVEAGFAALLRGTGIAEFLALGSQHGLHLGAATLRVLEGLPGPLLRHLGGGLRIGPGRRDVVLGPTFPLEPFSDGLGGLAPQEYAKHHQAHQCDAGNDPTQLGHGASSYPCSSGHGNHT